MLYRYIFMIKKQDIVPVSMSEPFVEKIIFSLIEQQFYVSHIHVDAKDARTALHIYHETMQGFGYVPCNKIKEAYVC